jgi:acyl carrier protein
MDQSEADIRGIVSRLSGLREDIGRDADLYLDLGVASVHAVQLLVELEEHFRVQIPDDDFVEAKSIATLTAMTKELVQ